MYVCVYVTRFYLSFFLHTTERIVEMWHFDDRHTSGKQCQKLCRQQRQVNTPKYFISAYTHTHTLIHTNDQTNIYLHFFWFGKRDFIFTAILKHTYSNTCACFYILVHTYVCSICLCELFYKFPLLRIILALHVHSEIGAKKGGKHFKLLSH